MYILLLVISIAISIGYTLMLYWIYRGWSNTPEWSIPPKWTPKTSVTVVIAARNEEQHIQKCIDSILRQHFPEHLLRIIVVDDQSSDNTLQILKSYKNDRLLILSNKENIGKKAAIDLAVTYARSTLIACTDADSIPTADWLRSVVSYYEQHKPQLIAGPIAYMTNSTILQHFQYLDGVTNMATTAAGIHYNAYYMANGANVVYEKALFERLNGYTNDTVASGDDMMLVQRAAKEGQNSIRFLKSKAAIVTTQPIHSISNLIEQRKRWATKSKHYTDKGVLYIQSYIFLVVAMLLFTGISALMSSNLSLFSFLFVLITKLLVDYTFLFKMTHYFGNTSSLKSFAFTSVWYILYILWASWNAIFPSKYVWKGRHVT